MRYLCTDIHVEMTEQRNKNCIFHSLLVKFLLNIYNFAELEVVAVINQTPYNREQSTVLPSFGQMVNYMCV